MFGHIRIFSPDTSKLRIRQNYFYNIFSGIGYIAANLPMTPNNSSIYGCQQASDFRFCPFTAFSPENLWWYHIFSEYFGCFHLWIFYMPNLSYFDAAMHQTVPVRVSTSILITSNPAFAQLCANGPGKLPYSTGITGFLCGKRPQYRRHLYIQKSPENRFLHFPGRFIFN